MSRQQGAVYFRETNSGCELQDSEVCSIHGSRNEPLQDRSATGNTLGRFLGERFRCHPVGTAVLILLLLLLVLALGVALAVQSAAPQVPVTPATAPLVLGCPHGWVLLKRVCYYFSRDHSTWEQGQERCSALGASLAIAKDRCESIHKSIQKLKDFTAQIKEDGESWLDDLFQEWSFAPWLRELCKIGLCVLGVLVVILIVIPCILQCVQRMMDKTVKDVFIIQEREVGNGFTESARNLMEMVGEGSEMEEGFEFRPWNRREFFEQ